MSKKGKFAGKATKTLPGEKLGVPATTPDVDQKIAATSPKAMAEAVIKGAKKPVDPLKIDVRDIIQNGGVEKYVVKEIDEKTGKATLVSVNNKIVLGRKFTGAEMAKAGYRIVGKAKAEDLKARKPKEPTTKGNKGSLGSLYGVSVVSVIRYLGKAGWSFNEAAHALGVLGAKPAPATIKIQLSAGRSGKAPPASLEAKNIKELDNLRKETPKNVK